MTSKNSFASSNNNALPTGQMDQIIAPGNHRFIIVQFETAATTWCIAQNTTKREFHRAITEKCGRQVWVFDGNKPAERISNNDETLEGAYFRYSFALDYPTNNITVYET